MAEKPYTSITQAVRIAANINNAEIAYINSFNGDQATPSNLELLDKTKTHLAEQSIFNPMLRQQLDKGVMPYAASFEIKAKADAIRANYSSEAINAKSNDAVLNLVEGDERKIEAKKILNSIELFPFHENAPAIENSYESVPARDVTSELEQVASRLLPFEEKEFRDPRAKGKPMLDAAIKKGIVPDVQGKGDRDLIGRTMAEKADLIKDRAAAVLPISHLGLTKAAALDANAPQTAADLLNVRDIER